MVYLVGLDQNGKPSKKMIPSRTAPKKMEELDKLGWTKMDIHENDKLARLSLEKLKKDLKSKRTNTYFVYDDVSSDPPKINVESVPRNQEDTKYTTLQSNRDYKNVKEFPSNSEAQDEKRSREKQIARGEYQTKISGTTHIVYDKINTYPIVPKYIVSKDEYKDLERLRKDNSVDNISEFDNKKSADEELNIRRRQIFKGEYDMSSKSEYKYLVWTRIDNNNNETHTSKKVLKSVEQKELERLQKEMDKGNVRNIKSYALEALANQDLKERK